MTAHGLIIAFVPVVEMGTGNPITGLNKTSKTRKVHDRKNVGNNDAVRSMVAIIGKQRALKKQHKRLQWRHSGGR